jgi:hypothetical protein
VVSKYEEHEGLTEVGDESNSEEYREIDQDEKVDNEDGC